MPFYASWFVMVIGLVAVLGGLALVARAARAAPVARVAPVSGARERSAAPQLVTRTEVIPGALEVALYQSLVRHGPEVFACFTFLSDGLLRYGQAEVQLTVVQGRDDDLATIARDVNRLFVAILGEARRGNPVGPGGFTALEGGFLGRADVRGVVYTPVPPHAAVEPRPGTLQARLLTQREIAVVQSNAGLATLAPRTE